MASIDAPDISTPVERELRLTPEQALQLAMDRHARGDLDGAEMIYEVVLERWPDHAQV